MKRSFFVLLFMLVYSFLLVAEIPSFEVAIGGRVGWLRDGAQRKFMEYILTPEPDNFPVRTFSAEAAYSPIRFLGIEVGTNQLCVIVATGGGAEDLNCYKTVVTCRLCMIGRFPGTSAPGYRPFFVR